MLGLFSSKSSLANPPLDLQILRSLDKKALLQDHRPKLESLNLKGAMGKNHEPQLDKQQLLAPISSFRTINGNWKLTANTKKKTQKCQKSQGIKQAINSSKNIKHVLTQRTDSFHYDSTQGKTAPEQSNNLT